MAQNAASDTRIAECECIIIGPTRSDIEYQNVVYDHASQDQLTVDDVTLLVVANVRAALAAGWEDKDAELVACTHIMAFLLGAMDNGGEWRIVPDPDVTTITNVEKSLIERFDRVAHTGSLVCAMGAINHYSINHTTGQGRLQGFGLKTARILSLPYSNERSAAAEDTRKKTTSLLYAAAHPMSKRNMLYVLDDTVINLKAAWVPGIPRPAQGCADQFLSMRIGGVPAGVRKIYVALEACRKIANSGLLCTMPGATVVRKMNEDMKVVKESSVSCHVGATYYLRGSGAEPVKVDQNKDEYRTILLCAGAYLHIVAPGSTLAQSPAFTNAIDEASAEFGDWVAECRAYAAALESRVSSGLADVMGKYSLGVSGIVKVENEEELPSWKDDTALIEIPKMGPQLSNGQKSELQGLLERFSDIMSNCPGKQILSNMRFIQHLTPLGCLLTEFPMPTRTWYSRSWVICSATVLLNHLKVNGHLPSCW